MNRLTTRFGAVAVLAAAIFAVQCSKTELSETGEADKTSGTVTLSIRNSESTKTGIDGQTGKIHWNTGDFIFINGVLKEVIPDENDPALATVPDVEESESYFVFYSASYPEENAGIHSVYFPSEQEYTAGSFNDFTNTMAGYSTTTDILLQNIGGVVKFGVTGGQTLKSLSFSPKDGSPVAGSITIPAEDLQSGKLQDHYSDFSTDYMDYASINVTFGEAGQIRLNEAEPTDFYIVVPAKTYTEGFYITMEDTEGNVAVKSTSGGKDVRRSEMLVLPDFEFTALAPPSIDIGESTATTVTYTVQAAPDTPFRTILMSTETWNYYINNSYAGKEDTLAIDIAGAYNTGTFFTDGSGIYEKTDTASFNASGWKVALTAQTDYKLIVSFSDNMSAKGIPSVFDLTTGAPGGETPVVNIEFTVSESPYKELIPTIRTENAASIKYGMYATDSYPGVTAEEILSLYGSELPSEGVDKANTEGLQLPYSNLEANTSYTFVVSASGDGGITVYSSAEKTTDYYISPDATWSVISTDATLECGFFENNMGFRRDFTGLTVEKMDGEDFFRIRNPFTAASFPDAGEYGITFLDKASCITIDATDPSAVKFELNENWLGISIEGFAESCIVSGPFYDTNMSFGQYDAGQKVIYFGDIYFGVGTSLYLSGRTVLYMNPDPESGGVGTESFVIKEETGW